MGSSNDWETMSHAAQQLKDLGLAYGARVISAHRSPDLLFDCIKDISAQGVHYFTAGAGHADSTQISQRYGFAVIHRTNAQGNIGCSLCNW